MPAVPIRSLLAIIIGTDVGGVAQVVPTEIITNSMLSLRGGDGFLVQAMGQRRINRKELKERGDQTEKSLLSIVIATSEGTKQSI